MTRKEALAILLFLLMNLFGCTPKEDTRIIQQLNELKTEIETLPKIEFLGGQRIDDHTVIYDLYIDDPSPKIYDFYIEDPSPKVYGMYVTYKGPLCPRGKE